MTMVAASELELCTCIWEAVKMNNAEVQVSVGLVYGKMLNCTLQRSK